MFGETYDDPHRPFVIDTGLGLVDFAVLPHLDHEDHRITLRFEAFNWVNHPNLGGAEGGGVSTDPTNLATFGRVLSKGGERNLQFSIRYSF